MTYSRTCGLFHSEAGMNRKGTGTFTFHEKAGTPVLVVEASLHDGHHYDRVDPPHEVN